MLKVLASLLLIISLGIYTNHLSGTQQLSKVKTMHFNKTKNFDFAIADTPEKNYANYCASCHGEKMDMFVDRKWKHGSSEQDLFKVIKQGYPDEGMPGFDTTFTDKEISDLADYIITGIDNIKRYDFQEAVRSNIFKTESLTIKLDTIAKGIKIPWGMAFMPNGEMLVTERGGKMYRVTKKREVQIISGVPDVVAEGQGGLLDIALHPDFKHNKLVYISYSLGKNVDNKLLTTTAVTKAVLKGNTLTEQKKIFEALPYSTTRHHYGSRLQFGKDGYLYISVGDRGNHNENAQSLERHAAKIHRIKDDGSIPVDNPFVNTPGAVGSIFSYGHRNPQGMAMHPKTGQIWTNEHGPRGGDEINIAQKGKNYGWPVISYGLNYDGTILTKNTAMKGMEHPLHYWIPSIGPSGMAFVTGNRYKGWNGNLLVGSLRFKYLNLCKLKGNKVIKEEILLKNIGRVRDVRMSPDGYIYVSVENPSSAIFRLIPVN